MCAALEVRSAAFFWILLYPAVSASKLARSERLSLDGRWGFRLVGRPEEAAGVSDWDTIEVPGLWTMQGFARPHYTNVAMPFDTDPPQVPDENPTGVYRRRFEAPAGWGEGPVGLALGGPEGLLY